MNKAIWLRRLGRDVVKRLPFRRQKTWDVLPNDVYLVSYPRSGNTWMRYLLANLLEPDGVWTIDNLRQVVPDIHEFWPQDWIERSPRIIKSHEAYQSSYPTVIYLYRDGRDVAVSYYDFKQKLQGYQGSFDQFLWEFLFGKQAFKSWQDHVSSWLWNEHQVNIFSIGYEALVVDTAAELTRLSEFLQTLWDSALITLAIEKSTVQRFRKDYQTLKFDTHWSKDFKGGVKGGPGKWREVFSRAQNDLFWEKAGDVMTQLGYLRE